MFYLLSIVEVLNCFGIRPVSGYRPSYLKADGYPLSCVIHSRVKIIGTEQMEELKISVGRRPYPYYSHKVKIQTSIKM